MSPSVVHIAAFAPQHPGNFVAALRALDRQGRERGVRSTFVFPVTAARHQWYASLAESGYAVVCVPPTDRPLPAASAILALARRTRADVLHTHFGGYDLAASLATRRLRKEGRRVALLWHLHSDLERGAAPLRRLREALRWRLLARDVHFIAVAEHIRQQAAARGADVARIRVLPNCVDTLQARLTDRGPAAAREAAGIGPAQRALVLYGWDPERKGVDLALDAVATLVPAAPDVVLAIIGGERLEGYLRKRFGARRPAWLRLLPAVPHPADYYGMAYAFLSPSRREGMPYSVVEAMANACPVVLSRIPGQLLMCQADGALDFPPGDTRALAGAVREILGWTNAEHARCGEANRQYVERHLGMARWTGDLLALYEEVLAT
jgi:glycosyltransferase involved in cell wall biosynthesis